MSSTTHPSTSYLVRLLDEAYRPPAWHGPTLRSALRGVDWRDAHWQPGSRRHSIRAIAVHAAYWKYVARRRITGETRGTFPLEGSNWFAPSDEPSARSWAADLVLLDDQHRQLRNVAAALTPRALRRPTSQGRTPGDEILGVAYHDVYHAGQIQLLKRLLADRAHA